MSVIYENPGIADINALLIMGESVKEGDNKIGYFGTGFKYACATILRSGGVIKIVIDGESHAITARRISIRGKDADALYFDDIPMNITTNLGRNWELWQADRELWSNCSDEGGESYFGPAESISAAKGRTFIIVTGQAYEDTANRRHEWLRLARGDSKLISQNYQHCHIYAGQTDLFYRASIRVHSLSEPAMYTYDFPTASLTEDRTMSGVTAYISNGHIARALLSAHYSDALSKTIRARRGEHHEANITASQWRTAFSSLTHPGYGGEESNHDPVVAHIKRAVEDGGSDTINDQFREFYQSIVSDDLSATATNAILSRKHAAALKRGKGIACRIEPRVADMPVIVMKTLGPGIMGKAKGGKCYLAEDTLNQGAEIIAGTLFEEWIHIQTGLGDHTRALQNYLINKIVSMAPKRKPR